MEVSRSEFDRVIHENTRLKAREQKEKSQAVEYTEKGVVGASAFAVGAGIGILNAQNGATAENPYQVGGQIGVDAVAAAAGAVAILATPVHGPSSKLMPLSLGAGAGAIAIFGQRFGYNYWQSRSGAAPAAPAATTQGVVGWGGRMAPRMSPPGSYGGSPYANPYVSAYG